MTWLLAACNPATSCRYSALLSCTEASRVFFLPRTAARPFSLIRRRCFSARTSDVLTAIVRVTVSTFFFVTAVFSRAACQRSFAPCTWRRDDCVLRADVADVVDLLEEVAEAVRRHEHVERRRLLLRLVDLDQARVQPPDGDVVLVREEVELLGLEAVELA